VLWFIQLTDAVDEVAVGVLANFVELCLFNILQSDNGTVDEAIEAFNATGETSDIFPPNVSALVHHIISKVCPGQPVCSGRGRCINAKCDCDEGTSTDDLCKRHS